MLTSSHLTRIASITGPFSLRKPKHREVKALALGHTAYKRQTNVPNCKITPLTLPFAAEGSLQEHPSCSSCGTVQQESLPLGLCLTIPFCVSIPPYPRCPWGLALRCCVLWLSLSCPDSGFLWLFSLVGKGDKEGVCMECGKQIVVPSCHGQQKSVSLAGRRMGRE